MTAAQAANNTPASPPHVLRAIGVGLVALLIGACGTKFLYDRLDRVAGWYLGGLVSLDADQRGSLNRWLEESLDWHRTSQLDRYAQFMRELQASLATPLTYEDYDRVRLEIEAFWRDLVGGVLPQSAELLGSLSPEQVDELLRSLEEEDREAEEEFASRSAQERAERREKRLRRSVERWTGRLDETQRRMVEIAAGDLVPLDRAWLDNRANWREQLRTALFAPADQGAAARVGQLLAEPERTWTESYREGVIHNRRRILEMLADLDATLSSVQRDRMRARLGELAENLQALAQG